MRGQGFTVAVPEGWRVAHTARAVVARKGEALVSASAFTLRKRYDPSLFDRAAAELDRVAAKLADAALGSLTESETTTVAGRKIRAYRFSASPPSRSRYDARIGFVLDGKREYQLYCQAAAGAGDPDGACALLFSSFSAD